MQPIHLSRKILNQKIFIWKLKLFFSKYWVARSPEFCQNIFWCDYGHHSNSAIGFQIICLRLALSEYSDALWSPRASALLLISTRHRQACKWSHPHVSWLKQSHSLVLNGPRQPNVGLWFVVRRWKHRLASRWVELIPGLLGGPRSTLSRLWRHPKIATVPGPRDVWRLPVNGVAWQSGGLGEFSEGGI